MLFKTESIKINLSEMEVLLDHELNKAVVTWGALRKVLAMLRKALVTLGTLRKALVTWGALRQVLARLRGASGSLGARG